MAHRALEYVHVLSAHLAPVLGCFPLASSDYPHHSEDAEQAHEGQQRGPPVVAQRREYERRRSNAAADHQPEHGVGDAVKHHHLARRKPLLRQESPGRLAGDDGDAKRDTTQYQQGETGRKGLGQQAQRAQHHGDGGQNFWGEP